MLLSTVFLQDTLLLLTFEVLLLHLELFVHHLELGWVGKRVDVCAVLVSLPCKHWAKGVCVYEEGGKEGGGGERERERKLD